MHTDTIKYAIIGCGTAARFHTSAILKTQGAELVGFYDRHKEVTQAFAKEYGVPAYESLDKLLSCKNVDVVSICTPSGGRLPIALAAAQQGKHILAEKPLEVTVERAERTIAGCHRQGVILGCVFQYRFYNDVRRVKELIDAGSLGKIVLAEAQVKWYRPKAYYENSSWRGTWALDGGGVLMNQAIHTIDLMQWFVGPVRDVKSHVGTLFHSIETEDTAVAALEFEAGTVGTISASTAAYPGLRALLSVHGTKGSAILAGERLIYLSIDDPTLKPVSQFGRVDQSSSGGMDPADIADWGHVQVIGDMTEAVRKQRKPAVTGEEALKSIKLIQSIYQAAK
ncbi:MAG: Gfo/Idh/MocA family oxidoreductase [Firmicutes bacterium]|nr:Gfo/Idh/MocA family oxidoreductase [Bacillota bacterium]